MSRKPKRQTRYTTKLGMVEGTTPPSVTDVGFVYTKSDNLAYFKTGAGVEHAIASIDDTQTLTNKTLTSPVINTGVSGPAFLDDDTMTTATDTTLASSESIKAYVDTQLTAEDLDFAGDAGTGSVDLDSQTFTISGTASEIETSATGQIITIGLPDVVAITTSLAIAGTVVIVGTIDDDTMGTATDTTLATSESIKAYVDTQLTAEDLDIAGDTGTDAIDLDSETLTFTGGTGITTAAVSGTSAITFAIDSTVATLTGAQILTNKTLTYPTIGEIKDLKEIVTVGCQQVVALDIFPWADVTETEAAETFCKSYNEDNAKFCNINVTNVQGEWTAAYQLFPDAEEIEDACYFGAAAAFSCLYFDISATAATYGDDSLTWEYWDGAAWVTLTLVYDHTDTVAQDGKRSFMQDGHILFTAPTDWASEVVDGQDAFWVRARVTGANITQIPLTDSHEHYVVTLLNGTQIPYSCDLNRAKFNFHTTSGANNDTLLYLWNATKNEVSAVVTVTQALKAPTVADLGVAVDADDEFAFYVSQIDTGTEYEYGICEIETKRL